MTQYYQHRTAALLAIAGSGILSFVDNFVAQISLEKSLWQFHFFRAVFALPVFIVWARVYGISLRPKKLGAVALRSVIVAAGLLLYFGALGFLPVAQAGSGIFSAPIWVLIFSVVLFKKRIGVAQILAIGAGFAGVLMLLQPDLANLSMLSLLPLVSGVFYGLGMMTTRHWCRGENALAVAAGVFVVFGIVGAIMLAGLTIWPLHSAIAPFLAKGWSTPTPRFLWLTLLQTLGAVVAVSLVTKAYRIGDPPSVSVFEYSFLVFAALWSYILWQQSTNALAIAGILVIIGSGITISVFGKTKDPE